MPQETQIVEYQTDRGKVQLSADLVRNYLVSGISGNVTRQEILQFIKICQYQRLNPWLREAYLIKFSPNQPASIVVGKDTFLKRAARNPKYQGHEVGVIEDKGKLTGAWAKVYVKGYKVPVYVEVDFEEYCQYTTKNGKTVPNRMWATKPKTMIKKVALCQALREAFPEDFTGLLSPEEAPVEIEKLKTTPIDIEGEIIEESKVTKEGKENEEKPKKKPESKVRLRLNIQLHENQKKLIEKQIWDNEKDYRNWMNRIFYKTTSKDLTVQEMKEAIGYQEDFMKFDNLREKLTERGFWDGDEDVWTWLRDKFNKNSIKELAPKEVKEGIKIMSQWFNEKKEKKVEQTNLEL